MSGHVMSIADASNGSVEHDRPLARRTRLAPGMIPCTIQQLGPRLGVSARALRFWEERGLLQPRRAAGGVRLYDALEVERAATIVTLRRHGVGLDQISRALVSGDQGALVQILEEALAAKKAEVRSLETLVEALRSDLAPAADA